jgi:alpha-beta hydrolase superfamily lysophospholipase
MANKTVNKAVEPFYQKIKTSDRHLIPLWHYYCQNSYPNDPKRNHQTIAHDHRDIKQVVIIVHGVGEHSGRYVELAQYLASQNRAVIVFDQRGHGQTIQQNQPGAIHPDSGWWHWQDDLDAVVNWCNDEYPHIPRVVYGQSLGSFIAQNYLIDHSEKITGAVLTGSNFISRNNAWLAKIVCASVMKVNAHKPSKLLNALVFLGANARTAQITKFDWISSNQPSVQHYVQDAHCGFVTPAMLWLQVFAGLEDLHPNRCSDKNIPIAFFAGTDDPIGNYGKGVSKLYRHYEQCGFTHLHQKLYPEQRHELHNEQDTHEFKADLIMWLENLLN